jgi:hypothetical protein
MKKTFTQNILIGCIILLLAIVFQLWPQSQPNLITVTDSYSPRLKYDENTYTQLGYLSRGTTKLILFGKPASHPRRDKWYYYTMVNNIKLPVEVNKRKCTTSPGCDSVSDKDHVIVDGQEYIVTMYESDFY